MKPDKGKPRRSAHAAALALLAGREHSRLQLARKLAQREYPEDEIAEALGVGGAVFLALAAGAVFLFWWRSAPPADEAGPGPDASYGVLERQFRRTYEEANRLQGPTGENLLRLLEQRLDNVTFRAGWASTRPQARQFVSHGLIQVNGKRVNIPSYRVRKGDVVSLSPKAQAMIIIQHNLDVLDRRVVGWLEAGDGGKQVTVRDLPQREHIDVPVRESLIVELYSK